MRSVIADTASAFVSRCRQRHGKRAGSRRDVPKVARPFQGRDKLRCPSVRASRSDALNPSGWPQGFVREAYEGVDAVIPLDEIETALPLAEVYQMVQFVPEAPEADEP